MLSGWKKHRTCGACLAFAAVVIACSFGADTSDAATIVGRVSKLVGSCEGTADGNVLALTAGGPVYLEEIVSTGEKARLEIGFNDGTVLRLGEKARLSIDSFVFRPEASGNRLAFTVVGAFRFVSGGLTKTAQADASIRTPFAAIGIRGTDFWGGPIDGAYGVFLLEGAVTITNGAGSALLNQPGQGLTLLSGSQPPGAVTVWPQEKARRALDAVAIP